MPDLPPELRDRAARAACDAWYADTPDHGWLAVVDVVAEVLAEHPGHWLGQRSIMDMENRMLQERVERAEADLAQARAVVEAAKALVEFHRDPMVCSPAPMTAELIAAIAVALSGPAGAAHTEEES